MVVAVVVWLCGSAGGSHGSLPRSKGGAEVQRAAASAAAGVGRSAKFPCREEPAPLVDEDAPMGGVFEPIANGTLVTMCAYPDAGVQHWKNHAFVCPAFFGVAHSQKTGSFLSWPEQRQSLLRKLGQERSDELDIEAEEGSGGLRATSRSRRASGGKESALVAKGVGGRWG